MQSRKGIYSLAVNIVCLLLLAGNIVYLIAIWGSLPDQIPGHYDFAGNVTRYDGKGSLLFLPIINGILYAGLSLLERFPSVWNTGVTVTAENQERVYRIIRNMLVTVKLSVVGWFVLLSVSQMSDGGLPGWYTAAFLLCMFFPMAFSVVKLVRAR